MTYDELILELENRNISRTEFCEKADISPQVLTNAKKRGGNFSATTQNKIDRYLGTNKKTVIYVANPHQKEYDAFFKMVNELREFYESITPQMHIIIEMCKEIGEDDTERVIEMMKLMFPGEFDSVISRVPENDKYED